MTHEEFDKIQADLLKEVVDITKTKGREYAYADNDRMANFKRAAQRKGISPLVALGVYLDKHMDAIDSYIRNERTFSTESVESRIVDAITYLTLMWGLILDEKLERNQREMQGEDYKQTCKVIDEGFATGLAGAMAGYKCRQCGNRTTHNPLLGLCNGCAAIEQRQATINAK